MKILPLPAGLTCGFPIHALSLALSLTSVSFVAQAAISTSQAWVPTKTQAFLPLLQAGAGNALALDAARAQDMVPGHKIHVVLALNLRNQPQLDALLQDLHRPASPAYRRFLSPAQFRERYCATPQQVAAVVAHLTQAGFVHIKVAGNRQLVEADGTAATVKAAFHTSLQQFVHKGRPVYANTQAAQVPASLGAIVGSVLGLQNVALNHTHHYIVPAATIASLDNVSVKGAAPHYPIEFSRLYDGANTPTASQTAVAIITSGDISQTRTDLQSFTDSNQLAPVTSSVIQTGPAGSDYSDTSGMVEWNLDSQSIVGSAGGQVGQILFYSSPTMDYAPITAAYNQAVVDNVARVINVSLGSCETDAHTTGTQAADDNIFRQAVAQGQTFSISSGDAGPYNCSVSPISGAPGVPNTRHYDVSEPASSPYVIAVGGTTLYTRSGSYSQETVWNEGLSAIGTYDNAGDYDATQRLWATGGGFSLYEAAPGWQLNITGSAKRGVPDVAFDAAGLTGARVLINGQFSTIGGTSLAAPIFTGIWARLQSAYGNTLGFPAASFYQHIPANPGLVHDVTSGNNGTGSYGYPAKAGWDADTGFGSLNISRLNAFIQATPDFAN